MGEADHPATWVYHLWAGGQDSYSDDFIESLHEWHDSEGMHSFHCHNCGSQVHVGGKGYNEQVDAYVRFGPVFICGECMNEAFDLPEIPTNWPSNPNA